MNAHDIKTALPGYFTTAEAAKALGYAGQSTMTNGCQSGKIPAYKVGKTWLIPEVWILEQIKTAPKPQGNRGVTRK